MNAQRARSAIPLARVPVRRWQKHLGDQQQRNDGVILKRRLESVKRQFAIGGPADWGAWTASTGGELPQPAGQTPFKQLRGRRAHGNPKPWLCSPGRQEKTARLSPAASHGDNSMAPPDPRLPTVLPHWDLRTMRSKACKDTWPSNSSRDKFLFHPQDRTGRELKNGIGENSSSPKSRRFPALPRRPPRS